MEAAVVLEELTAEDSMARCQRSAVVRFYDRPEADINGSSFV